MDRLRNEALVDNNYADTRNEYNSNQYDNRPAYNQN